MQSETSHGPVKRFLLLVRWRLLRLNRAQFHRWAYKLSRPASFPYVSGDGFRKLANHLEDAWWERISARRVEAGDILFVSTDHVRRFFEKTDPGIHVPYVLVTHNSDLPVDESLSATASPNVVRWFAQNSTHADPRIVPLPIGLENLHHYNAGIPERFERMQGVVAPKKARILVSFSLGINVPERRLAYETAGSMPCADRLPARLEQAEYIQTLLGYQFVLSPPGNGLDTHRTWEAMYLRVVPIVKDSVAMRSFAALGMPLWIVDDWDELLDMTETRLAARYESLRAGFSAPALLMDYWRARIVNSSEEIRAQSLPVRRGANTPH